MKIAVRKFFTDLRYLVTGFLGIFSETSVYSMMRFMSFFMFWFSLYETHFIVRKFLMILFPLI